MGLGFCTCSYSQKIVSKFYLYFICKYGTKSISDVTVPSSTQKRGKEKKVAKRGKKSHTEINKTIRETVEINKCIIKKAHTYNFRHKNVFIQNNTIKEEDKNYEDILEKSKTFLLEKNNPALQKFKAILETISEESNSKNDLSELDEYKEDIKNKNNDNMG